MKFRTEYLPVPSPFKLSPLQPVVMLGSCFSDNMLRRMRESLWNVVNPCGTLYNPLSIAFSLRTMLEIEGGERGEQEEGEKREKHVEQEDITERKKGADRTLKESLFRDAEGKVRSFLGDFRFVGNDEEEVLNKWRSASKVLQDTLKDAKALFITFGTAICYSLLSDNTPLPSARSREEIIASTVANCHKLPAARFERFRLSEEEIVAEWSNLCEELHLRYPELEIVFTVSPVRHLKDGFVGNMRSKAILLLAVERLCDELPYCSYFPAYEILNDDLRDYRFYDADLVHPSAQAVDYIRDIFCATYLDPSAMELLKKGEKIRKALLHRPLTSTPAEMGAWHDKVIHDYHEFLKINPKALPIEMISNC